MTALLPFLFGFASFPVLLMAHSFVKRRRRRALMANFDHLDFGEDEEEEDEWADEDDDWEIPTPDGTLLLDLDRGVVSCSRGFTPPSRVLLVQDGETTSLSMDPDRDIEFYGTMPGGDA